MTCRLHIPEDLARQDRWRPFVLLVAAARLDRTVGPVGVDGIALVPSRSVSDAFHEVRVVDGAAAGCSCWPARKGRCCAHRMAVAVRLWSDEAGLYLTDVHLSELLPLLVGVYLRPAGELVGEPDALPERKLAG